MPRSPSTHSVPFALLAAAVAVVLASCSDPARPSRRALDDHSVVIALLAVDVQELPAAMQIDTLPDGRRVVGIAEKHLEKLKADDTEPGLAEYAFTLDAPATMAVWLRVFWTDACGNSVRIAVDDAEQTLMVTDATYRSWHWVRAGQLAMTDGEHRMLLIPAEDGLQVEGMLLTSDLSGWPGDDVFAAADPPPDPPTPAPPTPPTPPAPESRPFRTAIGGCHRTGFESALTRLGIPWERLLANEIANLEALKRYDVVFFSCPDAPRKELIQVAEQYIREGGTLVSEFSMHCNPLVPALSAEKLFADDDYGRTVGDWNRRHEEYIHVRPDGSSVFPITGKTAKPILVSGDLNCLYLPKESITDDSEAFGDLLVDGAAVGKAVLRRPYGKGAFYYCAVPIAYHSMWRGRNLDESLLNLVRHIVGQRAYTPFAQMEPWGTGSDDGLIFADDFMRMQGTPGASWRTEAGSFRLTGESTWPTGHAFSLVSSSRGCLTAVGNPKWKDYRVAASVRFLPVRKADERAIIAGVWLTAGGARFALTFDNTASALRLHRIDAGKQIELGSAKVATRGRWHRLSLCQRNGAWEGWLDGERRLQVPVADGTDVLGPFGLYSGIGPVLFDDFTVRSTSSLLPGTDRATGEEGSSFVRHPAKPVSIEARNLFSRQWYLRPSPAGDSTLRLALPHYEEGRFFVDGKLAATLPPSAEPASVSLVRSGPPRFDIAFVTPGWRDYGFADRPTDWYSVGTEWASAPRWSCAQEWIWLSVDARRPSVLWHKPTLTPPYAFSAWMGAASLPRRGTWHETRDMNVAIAGNGESYKSGYWLRVREFQKGCELWKGDKKLASSPGIGLPDNGYALHHVWWDITSIVEPHRIRIFFEGKPAIDYKSVEAIPPGQIGVWTQNNNVSVARVTISRKSAKAPGSAPKASQANALPR